MRRKNALVSEPRSETSKGKEVGESTAAKGFALVWCSSATAKGYLQRAELRRQEGEKQRTTTPG